MKSNSIPLISFSCAAFRLTPILLLSSLIMHDKIQGNPIYAADPSPSPTGGAVLSSAPCFPSTSFLRLYFEHNERAFTTPSGGRKQLRQCASWECSADEKSIHSTTNQRNAVLDPEVGSLLLGLEHSRQHCRSSRRQRCLLYSEATPGTSILSDLLDRQSADLTTGMHFGASHGLQSDLINWDM